METVRAATADDVGVVTELLAALAEELGPMRGGAVWRRRDARAEPLAAAVQRMVSDPATEVLIGELDGSAVGVGVMTVETLTDGGSLARITELYVLEAAREVGLGEVLLDGLVAIATARGCIGVDAPALPGHRAAKNFFEDQGFTARLLTMHREL